MSTPRLRSTTACMHHEGGSPAVVHLAEPTLLTSGSGGAVLCAAGHVHLHPSGELESATLETEASLSGHALQRGDWITLREDGSLERAVFGRPRRYVEREDVRAVVFDSDGRMERFVVGDATYDSDGLVCERRLATSERIQGIACAAELVLFDAGRILDATLAEPLTTAFGIVPAGSRVRFAKDGSVRGGITSQACTLGTCELKQNDPFTVIEGRVSREGWTFTAPRPAKSH